MALPVVPKDFSQLYFATTDNIDIRKYVVEEIGEDNMSSFEQWAFNSRYPLAYDESIRFLWNQSHRGCPLIGSLKSSVMRMIDYWKASRTE